MYLNNLLILHFQNCCQDLNNCTVFVQFYWQLFFDLNCTRSMFWALSSKPFVRFWFLQEIVCGQWQLPQLLYKELFSFSYHSLKNASNLWERTLPSTSWQTKRKWVYPSKEHHVFERQHKYSINYLQLIVGARWRSPRTFVFIFLCNEALRFLSRASEDKADVDSCLWRIITFLSFTIGKKPSCWYNMMLCIPYPCFAGVNLLIAYCVRIQNVL